MELQILRFSLLHPGNLHLLKVSLYYWCGTYVFTSLLRSFHRQFYDIRYSKKRPSDFEHGNVILFDQVVTIAVYMFFLSTVLGRQFLDPAQNIDGHLFDTYVPVYTLMQFLFYMGWLKVGENLSNPFGEDDDDFDVCFLLDRNMKVIKQM